MCVLRMSCSFLQFCKRRFQFFLKFLQSRCILKRNLVKCNNNMGAAPEGREQHVRKDRSYKKDGQKRVQRDH